MMDPTPGKVGACSTHAEATGAYGNSEGSKQHAYRTNMAAGHGVEDIG
jgi:hypothetical protein